MCHHDPDRKTYFLLGHEGETSEPRAKLEVEIHSLDSTLDLQYLHEHTCGGQKISSRKPVDFSRETWVSSGNPGGGGFKDFVSSTKYCTSTPTVLVTASKVVASRKHKQNARQCFPHSCGIHAFAQFVHVGGGGGTGDDYVLRQHTPRFFSQQFDKLRVFWWTARRFPASFERPAVFFHLSL